MFFPRLRRHAKWMFLFLALAFGLGFVGFGVGAGGVGFGDILRGAGGARGLPSLHDAEGRVLATVFGGRTGAGRPGGYGVPNTVVAQVLERAVAGRGATVATGPCTS